MNQKPLSPFTTPRGSSRGRSSRLTAAGNNLRAFSRDMLVDTILYHAQELGVMSGIQQFRATGKVFPFEDVTTAKRALSNIRDVRT